MKVLAYIDYTAFMADTSKDDVSYHGIVFIENESNSEVMEVDTTLMAMADLPFTHCDVWDAFLHVCSLTVINDDNLSKYFHSKMTDMLELDAFEDLQGSAWEISAYMPTPSVWERMVKEDVNKRNTYVKSWIDALKIEPAIEPLSPNTQWMELLEAYRNANMDIDDFEDDEKFDDGDLDDDFLF